MKHRILVVDDYEKEFFDELINYGQVVKTSNIDAELNLEDITILVVRSKTRVDSELVDQMPNLQCVVTATHGVDHICVPYLKEKGIRFYNVPAQSYDVAQGVIAYILAYATKLVEGDRAMKLEEWAKKQLKGFRVRGKTLGIIGYGRIGKEVAQMASALGMKVVVYDPYIKDNEFTTSMTKLLEESDIITLHVPFTEETKKLIGRNEFKKMKRGTYLINTARGGIIDYEALLDAILDDKLGGAALDVYDNYPPFKNEIANKLIKSQKVIVTPHSIAQTKEAIKEKGKGVLEIIRSLNE